ncbi:hypothetical protein [Beggiatoa leptomitoformis]|uniref:Uncharacterized protein n=1 Tax=Beggiatoa leptomitoformis TaxID=288004 RepID=A0A2N9Y9Z6_9GAMM|nr:hypothetical protein [Beggiatoa leptomitoformis]ALG67288.2 hypothetical protein AL038_05690 [Beggiatoa leptomitoformis]AUI67283.2 hypothetical protein BLE401_00285 [Beggiatoa leptomitoformis]
MAYRSPLLQGVFVLLFVMYGMLLLWAKKGLVISSHFIYACLFVSFTFFITEIFSAFERNYYFVLQELKFLPLFLLPKFFESFLDRSTLTVWQRKKIITDACKGFIILVLLINIVYGPILGAFRGTGPFEYSISLSYAMVFIFIILFHELSLKWKLLLTTNIFMLGSTMGFALLALSWLIKVRRLLLVKVRLSIFSKVVFAIPVVLIALWYITVFRGRAVFGEDFWSLDRVQVVQASLDYAAAYFTTIDYLFGFGIGRLLENLDLITSTDYPVVYHWIIKDFTGDGEVLYSFVFHNEYIRLFYNFGIFAPLILFALLYKEINNKTLFLIIILASLTNSTIYSYITMFVIALAAYVSKLDKTLKVTSQLSAPIVLSRRYSLV